MSRRCHTSSQDSPGHRVVEVVYIEFEDGQSKEIHSKRQNGRAAKCSKYVSDLSQKENTEFATGMRRMKCNGEMKRLYESTKTNNEHCGYYNVHRCLMLMHLNALGQSMKRVRML